MTEQTKMETAESLEQDPVVNAALRSFRHSVHAWSEAEFSRPRAVMTAHPRVRRPWALVSCTLGAVLAAGVAVTGVHERNVRIEQQHIAAAQREAAQERELAAQRAKESEDLLAAVDKDVSREVPSALEPLAGILDDSPE